MTNIFEHTRASWVRYSDYEWREAEDGHFYLLPTPDAVPSIYDPTKVTNELVLAAVEIGRLLVGGTVPEKGRASIREFALKYGLLGIMTALPTTARFFDYEKVYDNYMKALMLTYSGRLDPQAMAMSFSRDYGERYEWMASVFKDWAFTLMATMIYYDEDDPANEATRKVYENGMAAFEGNAPTYHLELRDKPVIVWDFHSLLLNIKMMLNLLITDEDHPMRLCKQYMKPFLRQKQTNSFARRNAGGNIGGR